MSQWYQWFIAAPMMTIDLPCVLSALSANWRATVITSWSALHAGDRLLPRRRVGNVVVVGRRDVAAAQAAVDAVVRAAAGRTRSRPAPRRRRAASFFTGTLRTQDVAALVVVAEVLVRRCRRSTGTRPAPPRRGASISDSASLTSAPPRRPSPRGSTCRGRRPPSGPSGSRSSPAARPALPLASSTRHGLPVGVVRLAQAVGEVGRAQEAVGDAAVAALDAASPASACRCSGGSSPGSTPTAGRGGTPSGSRGPSPSRARRRCPASGAATGRRASTTSA